MNETIPEHQDRVTAGVALLQLADKEHLEFGMRYGFSRKRPQDWKDCSIFVFKWKTHRELDDLIDLDTRIINYIGPELVNPDRAFLVPRNEFWVRGGVYVTSHWDSPYWGVPDEFPQIQNFIRVNLPKWAEERKK